MGLQFRVLSSDYLNDSGTYNCSKDCSSSSDDCDVECMRYCSTFCPPKAPTTHSTKSIKFLITGVVLASTFLLVCFYAIYIKFYSRRRRRSSEEDQRNETTHEEFLDEEHGPVIDHPIWYINTVGLQPSVISSIAVCKYKRGDGLVEGTDCSVCLTEFQEDETLRLLPKCSHAFHIPCIDTWLRSHTNCPLCRAPIVTSANQTGTTSSSTPSSNESMSNMEETQLGILENVGETGGEVEGGDGGLRNGAEEEEQEEELHDHNGRTRVEELNDEGEGIQQMRRSVSLDSLSAFKITQALVNVGTIVSNRNSSNRLIEKNTSGMGIVQKKVVGGGGNPSLLKFMTASSIGRSLQIGPSSLKRSLSCGGKLFLSRYRRNSSSSSSVLPF